MEFMEGIVVNKKKSYKNPVFLFTSCSLRFAAWAGWYSAFGDKEKSNKLSFVVINPVIAKPIDL